MEALSEPLALVCGHEQRAVILDRHRHGARIGLDDAVDIAEGTDAQRMAAAGAEIDQVGGGAGGVEPADSLLMMAAITA